MLCSVVTPGKDQAFLIVGISRNADVGSICVSLTMKVTRHLPLPAYIEL